MNTTEQVRRDPAELFARMWIDCDGQRRLYAQAWDDWQRRDLEAMFGALQRAAGQPCTYPDPRKWFWIERPRAHSKSTDQAACAMYWCNACSRPLKGYVLAGDSDQAAIVIDACRTLKALNPSLANLDVQRSRVVNRASGAELVVMSSDEATSWGILPSLIIADEVSVWPDTSEGLLYSLLSSAAKKRSCMFVAITNAGAFNTWQWAAREQARDSAEWYFNSLESSQASWIDPATLEQQKRFLPASEYARVWCNQWTDMSGDYLDPSKILAAITLSGPMTAKPPGEWAFVAGLDLGVRRDRSSLVVLATERKSNRVSLAWCQSWKPEPGSEVSLNDVERAVLRCHRRYGLSDVIADQWQAVMLLQNLGRQGVPTETVHFTSKQTTRMAMSLMEIINAGNLNLFDDKQLIDDLRRIIIEPTLDNGYKISASRDRNGHADSAIALCLALPRAMELAGALAVQRGVPEHMAWKRNPSRFGIQVDRIGNTAATEWARAQRNEQLAHDALKYGI